ASKFDTSFTLRHVALSREKGTGAVERKEEVARASERRRRGGSEDQLVGDEVDPGLCALDPAHHPAELLADGAMLNEFLSKRFALLRIPERFLEANAGKSIRLDSQRHPLVVEIEPD